MTTLLLLIDCLRTRLCVARNGLGPLSGGQARGAGDSWRGSDVARDLAVVAGLRADAHVVGGHYDGLVHVGHDGRADHEIGAAARGPRVVVAPLSVGEAREHGLSGLCPARARDAAHVPGERVVALASARLGVGGERRFQVRPEAPAHVGGGARDDLFQIGARRVGRVGEAFLDFGCVAARTRARLGRVPLGVVAHWCGGVNSDGLVGRWRR